MRNNTDNNRLSIKKITNGICGSLLDFMIWQIALVGASFGQTGPQGVHKAFREADELLEKVNHNTLYSCWCNLMRNNLITYKKMGKKYYPEITKYGQQHLKQTFPAFQKNRPWNKRIYLITYDIPEIHRVKREYLRLFLLKIKSVLLQESTFLTPYDPRELVHAFISEKKIPGTIIVSDIGPDGAVGDTTITDLLISLYKLEDMNNRYKDFIELSKKNKNTYTHFLIFRYLSILKNDPQLPYPLLPKWWLGDKANTEYNNILKIYIKSTATAGKNI
jgi:DNA-binding transcriptional regulator PaaX